MKKLQVKDGDQTLNIEIEKMDAFSAEDWLIRAGLMLGKGASEAGKIQNVIGLVSALCRVQYSEAKPLLDRLLECCYIVNGDFRQRVSEARSRIQSPITLMKLRIESGKETFGFLPHGGELDSLMSSLGGLIAPKSAGQQDTPTSRPDAAV